jgi:predicted  nucleic acid-binding Zn-ribbon protein
LERELLENNAALQIATDTNDTKTIDKMKNEIQELNQRLTILKRERDNLKSNVSYIENEINSANKESINLYYEFDKQTPRATIP